MTDNTATAVLAKAIEEATDINAFIAAVDAIHIQDGHGIKKKTASWETVYSDKCPNKLAEQYCVHIEYENGEVFDRCGSMRCV